MIKTTCAYCGTELEVKPYRLRRYRHVFCSRQCKGKYASESEKMSGENNPQWKGGNIKTTCATCRVEIEIKRCLLKERNYCSPECQHVGLIGISKGEKSAVYNSITLSCDYCGKDIIKQSHRAKRNNHNFCNIACFSRWKSQNWRQENNPAWRDGYNGYRGKNWERQARRARKRDSHTCQKCGITEKQIGRALDVHHIVRFNDFDGDWRAANQLSNLISYCHACHMAVEYQ